MKRETDVIMEKHALVKIRELYSTDMPTVKLIGTFKDELHLYFLTEMFKSKCEVWEHVRSFGMLNHLEQSTPFTRYAGAFKNCTKLKSFTEI